MEMANPASDLFSLDTQGTQSFDEFVNANGLTVKADVQVYDEKNINRVKDDFNAKGFVVEAAKANSDSIRFSIDNGKVYWDTELRSTKVSIASNEKGELVTIVTLSNKRVLVAPTISQYKISEAA